MLRHSIAENTNTTIKQDTADKTAQTKVSYTIAANESYTVTIPSGVALTNTDGTLSGSIEIGLDASNFNTTGKTIEVKLTDGAFELVNGENKIQYEIKKSNEKVVKNDTVLSWICTGTGSASQTETLAVSANNVAANLPAGEYTDTLTFTVSVTDSGSNADGIQNLEDITAED